MTGWHEPGRLHRLRRAVYPRWAWDRYLARKLDAYQAARARDAGAAALLGDVARGDWRAAQQRLRMIDGRWRPQRADDRGPWRWDAERGRWCGVRPPGVPPNPPPPPRAQPHPPKFEERTSYWRSPFDDLSGLRLCGHCARIARMRAAGYFAAVGRLSPTVADGATVVG